MQEVRQPAPEALIIGAGIAGPALALALHRVGLSSTIFEDSPAPRDDAGAFLNLAPNGLTALSALELRERVEHLGFRNDRLVFRNESGRTLAGVDVGGVTLMRGALSRFLREAAVDAGVHIVYGKRLEDVETHAQGVRAHFADGSSAAGSMLIGCDGIHSRTRVSVFGSDPAPAYTGILNLGGVVQTDLPPTGRAMNMIFGRRGFFGYAVRPSGDTWWFSNYAEPVEPRRESLGPLDAGQVRDVLADRHRDDPPEVSRIINALTGSVGTYPVYDIMTLPRWQAGRVCLIGDAAHAVGPHVGQGASLAFEDALMLAACLRDLKAPDAAFSTFEILRRSRVERVAKQSRRTGRRKAPAGALARRIRDFVLPIFLKKSARDAQRVYEWSFN